MKTRLATLGNLSRVMEIEEESFGDIDEEAMASCEMMKERIILCNAHEPGWFWIAEEANQVCGYVLLQPTRMHPDDCTAWETATDSGSLRSTFAADGETIFGVSMGMAPSAPRAAFYMLVHRAMVLFVQTRKKRLMLCSRLPGLRAAHEGKGIDAETYWRLVDTRGTPQDPLLKMFHSAFGVGPYKFMRDGFPIDRESEGHSALIVVEDPYQSLTLCAERIYAVSKAK